MDYFENNAIALVEVLQFGKTASILLSLKGVRVAAFLGRCNPVVLCYKGLIQLYRVCSSRQSIYGGHGTGTSEQLFSVHQQRPLLQVG